MIGFAKKTDCRPNMLGISMKPPEHHFFDTHSSFLNEDRQTEMDTIKQIRAERQLALDRLASVFGSKKESVKTADHSSTP